MRRRHLLATPLTLLTGPYQRTTRPYTPIGHLDIPGAKDAVITTDHNIAIATTNGFVLVDTATPETPRLLAENRRVLGDLPNGPLQDIWDLAVHDSTLAIVGPAHSHRDDQLAALAVYDITDPTNPRRQTIHRTDYPIHNCALDAATAYLTANDGDRNPLVTVDTTTGEERGRWSIIDVDKRWADVPAPLRTLHDVTIHGAFAVLAHWDAGTWILDVSDPATPTYRDRVGAYTPTEVPTDDAEYAQLPGNAHFATLDPSRTILGVGREAWDIDPDDGRDGGPGGIDLYRRSRATDPTHLATVSPPPTPDPSPDGVWTTAHNFELTDKRLYAAWYRGGITIHDITDPTTPERLAWWRRPDTTSFWTARRGNGWVAATSRRDPPQADGRGAGLYLFPDRPGTQPDPPPLTPTTTTRPTTTITTTTPTTTTTTTTATTTTTTTRTPGQPGFGMVTVGAAFLYLTYRYLADR